MLHEILLSLSGHPSVLFGAQDPARHLKPDSFPLLSPPEVQLLSSVGHLSSLHIRTRNHASNIAASHPSAICRAVATAITAHHLENFQRKIQEVEGQILMQDSTTVGAYNIVPLAGLVAEFSGWTKLMEWLWSIACFMLPSDASRMGKFSQGSDGDVASGAAIMDKLRTEAQTGYPDIENAAVYLGKVAEASWLRQLSGWVLYGRLPPFGTSDFFIQPEPEESDGYGFIIIHKLLPNFVTRQTASSILFIGKSLNQIRSFDKTSKTSTRSITSASELELLPFHIKKLSGISSPISSATLSEAIASIRLSLSRNMLQHLLPIEKILDILMVLYEFFLLGRGEFPMALISEADKQVRSRHQQYGQSQHGRVVQGILLKEGEVASVLARSWLILSSLSQEDTRTDDSLDLATKIIHLMPYSSSNSRPGTPGRAKESISSFPKITNVVFHDFLFSIPTHLTMDVRSSLDLFITNADLDTYSAINAYLLTLRRAHLHLTQLWRQSSIRREHPAPPGPLFSSSTHGRALLKRRRQRLDIRSRDMRKVWATCSAAVFFLAESEAYFQGEVIQGSWKAFRDWILDQEQQSIPEEIPSHERTAGDSEKFTASASTQAPHHDPETIASAHRSFLATIAFYLLLTDRTFTKVIREFFRHVDELVALISRLQTIQQNLDLEEDEGVEDSLANYNQEEKEVSLSLDRARKRLDSDMKALIARLRAIDAERIGLGPISSSQSSESPTFEPLRVGGVDRLLMKLDWAELEEDEEDD
ncbi:Spc98 family protein [Delitschia confertaspora ATCC 74209]|uniref:Spindle pole body component n=1 Tax=Delitschia confertaspora ATCC 74209 TaxID=1513339 RepID=A0A9P4JJ37_9PLEO|nr:Spc98 family protein [Delitschia confertaspora ATCC 74209]